MAELATTNLLQALAGYDPKDPVTAYSVGEVPASYTRALKPDALIMADPGLIMMVRDRWPDLPVHLSVQANTTNWAAVKFWQKMGVERVILSRE